jgi:superfamily I DNA/RNA helicase/RecB family exonuclease
VLLRRERLRTAPPPSLDASQRAVVEHRGRPLQVLGAPGTGKTTALVEAVVDRVQRDGVDPGSVLVLAPTRLAAARLRELVTGRLSVTVREPLARTPQSFAFGVLRQVAARDGLPAPRLITGPEQDVVLRDLLAGHLAGAGRAPRWPDDLRQALTTRGFRGQLRDLVMRAVERGLSPDELVALGTQHGRPEWVASADVLAEYLDVTALATPGAYDPAAIAAEARAALLDDDELLQQVRAQVQLVAVDDAHEATAAVADLVDVVVGGRPALVVAGDPDAVTQSFRGADPGLLLGRPGSPARDVVLLGTSWRQGPALRAVSRRVAQRIGAVGGGRQRDAVSPVEPVEQCRDAAAVAVVRTPAHEVAVIADLLRRKHLLDDVPWAQMAVLVRGRTRAADLRRGLARAGVPVDVPLTELPVRDQPAVVPLLDAFEIGLAIAAGDEQPLDTERAEALLTSPLGGADAIALRRLRRALRALELGGGGGRSSDALLVEALRDPVRLAMVDRFTAAPAHRVATVLAAAAAAAVPASDDAPAGRAFATGVTAETVLWALWSASGLAPAWQRQALAGGPAGARADRDLDAVVALFDAASRFVDRLPQAGPREFLSYLRDQDVPADTLAERGAGGGVSLLTPAAAAGREWQVVAVAGVQEGVWPDLRPRGSLLGAEHLVDVLNGRASDGVGATQAAAAAVRDDELRLFHVAVSRARETLLVTAVRDDEEQPSPLLDLVDPPPSSVPAPGWDAEGIRTPVAPPVPLSLPGVVAGLRQTVCDPASAPAEVDAAARRLARLADAGVPGAHPDDWYGLAPLTDDRPLATDAPVRVSPSKVEEFDRCALRWLLQASGGTRSGTASQQLGTLVHELAAELPDADEPRLVAELHRRWAVLGLGEGWVADVGRRRAEDVVRKLAHYLRSARARELVGTELDVDVELDLPGGRARLTGRVDRLERDGDALRVVDLKTGKTPPKKTDLEQQPQLGAYQLAVQAGAFDELAPGARTGGAALVQLGSSAKKPGEQEQPALPDDGGWAVELLDRVATGMVGAGFAASVNDLCDRCPVRTSCPARGEGRRVTA